MSIGCASKIENDLISINNEVDSIERVYPKRNRKIVYVDAMFDAKRRKIDHLIKSDSVKLNLKYLDFYVIRM